MLTRRRSLLVVAAAASCAGKSTERAKGADSGPASDGGYLGDAAGDVAPCAGVFVGAIDDFAHATWVRVQLGAQAAFLVRDDDGFYAYAATCTHEACALELVDAFGNARCPCHDARFDGAGAVLRGPATMPLPHYAVSLCERRVYVDAANIVPPTSRTAP